jgi:hypothetical protein
MRALFLLALLTTACDDGTLPPTSPASTEPPPAPAPAPALAPSPAPAPTPAPAAPAPASTDPTERPEAALDRCEASAEPAPCIVAALGEREALRARERQALIEALVVLGEQDRALDHKALFVRDYPYDRRSNRHRLDLEAAGRL